MLSYLSHHTNSGTQMAGNNSIYDNKSEYCISKSMGSADSGSEQEAWHWGRGGGKPGRECRNTNHFRHLVAHSFNIYTSASYVLVPRGVWMSQGSLFLYLWSVLQLLIPNSPDEAPPWTCGPGWQSVEAWNELFASWLRILKCNNNTDRLKNS